MTHEDIVLLAIGSFLPNNLLLWVVDKVFHPKPKGKHKAGLWGPTFSAIRKDYHKFEVDPKVQLKYHRKMMVFWMLNVLPMNAIVGLDIYAALHKEVMLSTLLSAVLLALNTNYSLYANWDTETGDAHAAYAGIRADQIHSTQANVPEVASVTLQPGLVITPEVWDGDGTV